MPEISHVRIAVPAQGVLNRILREGGAQLFPQWLYAEPGPEPRILWWGVRGARSAPDAAAGTTGGLLPREVDDWTEAPRGLVLATVDLDRAVADLSPLFEVGWHDAGVDPELGATCRRATLDRSTLVLAEPSTEGYTAACLARFGEGPIAVALDGSSESGRSATTNPISDGPASYVRIGPGTAPTLIFLAPQSGR
jgi:hypothetical protein